MKIVVIDIGQNHCNQKRRLQFEEILKETVKIGFLQTLYINSLEETGKYATNNKLFDGTDILIIEVTDLCPWEEPNSCILTLIRQSLLVEKPLFLASSACLSLIYLSALNGVLLNKPIKLLKPGETLQSRDFFYLEEMSGDILNSQGRPIVNSGLHLSRHDQRNVYLPRPKFLGSELNSLPNSLQLPKQALSHFIFKGLSGKGPLSNLLKDPSIGRQRLQAHPVVFLEEKARYKVLGFSDKAPQIIERGQSIGIAFSLLTDRPGVKETLGTLLLQGFLQEQLRKIRVNFKTKKLEEQSEFYQNRPKNVGGQESNIVGIYPRRQKLSHESRIRHTDRFTNLNNTHRYQKQKHILRSLSLRKSGQSPLADSWTSSLEKFEQKRAKSIDSSRQEATLNSTPLEKPSLSSPIWGDRLPKVPPKRRYKLKKSRIEEESERIAHPFRL